MAELDSFDENGAGTILRLQSHGKITGQNLSTYFKYPKLSTSDLYHGTRLKDLTASSKVTKSKTVFPSDDSLLKMLYLAMIDITKKWRHRQDWGQIHSQLEIFFEERLKGYKQNVC